MAQLSIDHRSKLSGRWPSSAFVFRKPSPMGWARQMNGPLARSAETFIECLLRRKTRILVDE